MTYTSDDLLGLEADLLDSRDGVGAETARQCAVKMKRMEEIIRSIINGFTPRIGELKEFVDPDEPDSDIFAGREHCSAFLRC